MKTNPIESDKKPGEIGSMTVLAARLTWVVVGPAALVLVLAGIVGNATGWFTGLDALFGAVVGLMALARWVEQRSGVATTIAGEPSTIEHCRRYILILMLSALGLWIAANVLSNHILA